MIDFLAKIFIKNKDKMEDTKLRLAYGMLCGLVGIGLNLLLFGGKLLAGIISGSIAILADAFNNLADAGSSAITFIGFKLSGQKPDPDHPFGHGRIEYISGLIVAMAILLMAFELAKSSITKIISPEPVAFSILSVVILVIAILVKLYMAFYNRNIGKRFASPAMKAVAIDSISDCFATTVVLLALVVGHFTGINIDGWCGVAVSLFIFYAGFSAAKETINPLLGQPADKELVNKIESIVRGHKEIQGIHDLVVHDYGPGRLIISLHAEVPCKCDILEIHDIIDNIENELNQSLGCEAVIHMDPIVVDDLETSALKTAISDIIAHLSPELSIHDFRMVPGPTHTNLIFDVVVPYDFSYSDNAVKQHLIHGVESMEGNYFAVIKIDKPYIR
ncbi:MAG: cation diffusion facilitator family transporter [Clostridiales bacterium]